MEQHVDDYALYRERLERYTYADDGMNGYVSTLELRPGMHLCVSDLIFGDSFRYHSRSEESWMELSYCLKGGMSNEIYDYYDKANERDNHCFLLMSKGCEGVVEFIGGQRSVKVELMMDPQIWGFSVRQLWNCDSDEQLHELLDRHAFHVKETPTELSIQSILHQIVQCPHEGIHRSLFLESKALELLALAPVQWKPDGAFRPDRGLQSGLKRKDRSTVYAARDILMERMENPPSLAELAKMVSVSDWTLKAGFREVFGTTVFGYLRNFRLQQGRGYIEQGMSVNEASCAVGYSNPSYFATEFRKKYGMNPGELK